MRKTVTGSIALTSTGWGGFCIPSKSFPFREWFYTGLRVAKKRIAVKELVT